MKIGRFWVGLAVLSLTLPAFADDVVPTPPIVTAAITNWKAMIAAQAAHSAAIDAMAPQLQALANDDIQMHKALDAAIALGNWWENYAQGLDKTLPK